MRTSPAKEKLLDSASALFYEDGIGATAVDDVVRAAGVSKPTLYAHFGSKAELVAAVLERRHAARAEELEAIEGGPLAVFDWLAGFYERDGRPRLRVRQRRGGAHGARAGPRRRRAREGVAARPS